MACLTPPTSWAAGASARSTDLSHRSLLALLIGHGLALGLPTNLQSQAANNSTPVIDTIIVVRQNVFTEEQERKNFLFRAANRLRFPTREWVIRQELLFEQGEPLDMRRIEESERNLRARRIFRHVEIDTSHVADKLAVIIRARDGWSTKLKFNVAVAADGRLTGVVGITEVNLLGTGNRLHLAYRKRIDRDGFELRSVLPRLIGPLRLLGGFELLSDGDLAFWRFGQPFRAYHDHREAEYDGEFADRRILQFRTEVAGGTDTTSFQRRAFIHRLTLSAAPKASSTRYWRAGGTAEIREESYILRQDRNLMIPDTTTGLIGAFTEYSRARFRKIRYFNGFATEDQNLSTTLKLTAKLAPKLFGYDRTGIGPRIDVRGAFSVGESSFIRGAMEANGLFNAAGLDSGRVVLSVTFGAQPMHRHASIFHVGGGILENPAPGGEFDLGFETPPRLLDPHAFTGTRSVWATFEHRWFVWDEILGLFGLGFAAFFDWGGAWFEDQDSRFGGNVGIGLRTGSAVTTRAVTGRVDLGVLLGPQIEGDRLRLSIGSGFVF